MAYKIEGKLLEVCSCNVLCPCWIGEDPDGGTCDSALAWHIDKGEIEGVDVSGQTRRAVRPHSRQRPHARIVEGRGVRQRFGDRRAAGAILKVFTGQLGGAIADFAALIGEVVSVERVPITFTVDEGKGRLVIGSVADAQLTPYSGATGNLTTLGETAFSTIPGSPVYVAKADHFTRDGAPYGLPSVDLRGNNALQGHFAFAA